LGEKTYVEKQRFDLEKGMQDRGRNWNRDFHI